MSLESPILADRVLYPRVIENNTLPNVDEFNKWSDRQKKLFVLSRMVRFGLLSDWHIDRRQLRSCIPGIVEQYQTFLELAHRRIFDVVDYKDAHSNITGRHFINALSTRYEEEILKNPVHGIEDIFFYTNAAHGVYGFRTVCGRDPEYNYIIRMVIMEETTFRQYCAMAYKEGQKYLGKCASKSGVATLDQMSFFEPIYTDYEGMESTEYLTSKILTKIGLHKMPFDEFMSLLKINFQRGREGDAGLVYGFYKRDGGSESL